MPHRHHHAGHAALIGRTIPADEDYLPLLVPVHDAPDTVTFPLAGRSSEDSEEKCPEGDDSPRCEKPASATGTTTLPIVLGAVIPITCAIILFIFLHRRHVRKLRAEDANDRHKSLDFGMEVVRQGKKHKGGDMGADGFAGLETTEKTTRRGGVSLDLGNPYLLPPGLQGSRESLHSLSRTIHAEDDRYRTATSFIPNDTSSMRSHPSNFRRPRDDSSSFTGSSSRLGADDMQHNLLRNAQRMSRTTPPDSIAEQSISHPPPPSDSRQTGMDIEPHATSHPQDHFAPVPEVSPNPTFIPEISTTAHDFDLPPMTSNSPPPKDTPLPPRMGSLPPTPISKDGQDTLEMPRISFPHSDTSLQPGDSVDNSFDYGHADKSGPMVPEVNVLSVEDDQADHKKDQLRPVDDLYDYTYDDPGFDTRRLTVGIRPLPPEDPSDNPEQRANRIRSFYKEYFDDSKPQQEEYYEDYGGDQFDDPGAYDHMAEHYMPPAPPPFAQPMGRRAMTPPPRAPPQFQNSFHHSSMSSAGFRPPPGPRAFSSASGRMGPGGRAGMPRKPMPPPSPLHVLPTPHMLKDDSMILPIDYAPASFKDKRAGRPETPTGGLRPYSPMLPAHIPLASSYDDLAVMPSPHALRRSGTFTALDFAPPPRFKGEGDTASDSGSIRSNRTGISAAHNHNLRTGAYRVSRLPPEAVGTRDQLTSNLRPKWDMR